MEAGGLRSPTVAADSTPNLRESVNAGSGHSGSIETAKVGNATSARIAREAEAYRQSILQGMICGAPAMSEDFE